MNIIWVINNEIPFIQSEDGLKFVNEGWITGMLLAIKDYCNNLKLTILYPQSKSKSNITKTIDGINTIGYYRNFNPIKYNKHLESKFAEIISEVKPDVIHIMGTEYPHTYSVCSACEDLGILNKIVISIQGLVSKCSLKYTSGLPNSVIYSYTFRDLLKGNIYHDMISFKKRGVYEEKALKLTNNIIGRTEWDYASVTQINNSVNYHFNNEVLRKNFYEKKWEYDKCNKYTIFVSQGGYPIKGLHYAIRALSIVKEKYPNVKLIVAGHNILKTPFYKKNGYSKYIEKMIKKFNLSDNIEFTGLLSEEQMINQYLKANVFVSPSTLENSPNSLGEAMILGVPSISSDVGGVKNFIEHQINGYIYPCDEPYMLAYYIMEYFDKPSISIEMGKQSMLKAQEIFNRKNNVQELESIYKKISNNK